MKHLRGYTKRYFSLAIIAIYSTLHKLCMVDTKQQYHIYAYKIQEYKPSPPAEIV